MGAGRGFCSSRKAFAQPQRHGKNTVSVKLAGHISTPSGTIDVMCFDLISVGSHHPCGIGDLRPVCCGARGVGWVASPRVLLLACSWVLSDAACLVR